MTRKCLNYIKVIFKKGIISMDTRFLFEGKFPINFFFVNKIIHFDGNS